MERLGVSTAIVYIAGGWGPREEISSFIDISAGVSEGLEKPIWHSAIGRPVK